MNRKHYIDNLRILCIFMLFPFHGMMFYNSFAPDNGHQFYVNIAQCHPLDFINISVYPWWMSLLFVLAGMSTVYAFKRRSAGQYAKERLLKLFVPLVFGILLIAPGQSYIADIFHNGYTGNYFEHLGIFFTKCTDMTGYDGAFTPAHLWFILYLFVISMLCLPLTAWYAKRKKKPDFGEIPALVLYLVPPVLLGAASLVLDLGGKSVGDFLVCFLLGFLVLADENVQKRLKKDAVPLGIIWAALIAMRCIVYGLNTTPEGFGYDAFYFLNYHFLEWFGVVAAIALSQRFLNFDSGFTRYFTPAIFPMYYVHQTVMVVLAFFLERLTHSTAIGYPLLIAATFILSVACYELFKRTPVTRFMFGIKKENKNKAREKSLIS